MQAMRSPLSKGEPGVSLSPPMRIVDAAVVFVEPVGVGFSIVLLMAKLMAVVASSNETAAKFHELVVNFADELIVSAAALLVE